MGSLHLFLNPKLAVQFSSADYCFREKPQSLYPINRAMVPFTWSLRESLPSVPRKLGYRGNNKSVILHRFCCQSTANFEEITSMIHAKHEGSASNATENISALDYPDRSRGLGIVDFMKERNFLITGATGFLAKGTGQIPSFRY